MSDEDYKKIFSKNLKYHMELNNKTQMNLVNDLNLSQSTVSNWCTGEKLPRMNKIQMLADYFGIEKSDLLEEKSASNHTVLTRRDEREIAKDLDRIMDKIAKGEDGPLRYNGEEIDPESLSFLRNAIEVGLRALKPINKEKFTRKDYKK